MYFVISDIFLEFFFRNFPEIFCFYFSLLILKFYFIFHFLINFTSYLIISFHHLILTGDLNSDSESDDSDDDYNPEKEKMENQDNNDISDQGYDTDELSEEESDDNHNSNDDEDNQREKSEDDDYYKFKQNNLMERDKILQNGFFIK